MATARRIAALMTCHNRREQSIRCLERLHSQVLGADLEVFLVDDGSTDGTAAAVRERFPSIHLLHGDGTLYWTGGMRMAMQAAIPGKFDFYLWLNDDTRLYPDAIERLLKTNDTLVSRGEAPVIVVGSICDPESGALTYGGSVHASRWQPLRFRRIPASMEPVRCDVFNGNCVLFSRDAVERVGNLDPSLHHAAGDYEYGLRASKCGVTSWIAPGIYGECRRNPIRGTWEDHTVPLLKRYKMLLGVKGHPPIPRLNYYYHHGGKFWFFLYPLVYFRPLVHSIKKFFVRVDD
jgi:GT2 family glycosyltransferase